MAFLQRFTLLSLAAFSCLMLLASASAHPPAPVNETWRCHSRSGIQDCRFKCVVKTLEEREIRKEGRVVAYQQSKSQADRWRIVIWRGKTPANPDLGGAEVIHIVGDHYCNFGEGKQKRDPQPLDSRYDYQ